jgi:hypothetical protein
MKHELAQSESLPRCHYKLQIMQMRPSWESSNCSGTHEIPSILQNLEVHYHICKESVTGLYPVPHEFSPHPCILFLCDPCMSRLPSGHFSHIKFQCNSLLSPVLYALSSSHPPLFDHSNLVSTNYENSNQAIFSSLLFHSFQVHILSSAPYSQNPLSTSIQFSLEVKTQVTYPHKITLHPKL